MTITMVLYFMTSTMMMYDAASVLVLSACWIWICDYYLLAWFSSLSNIRSEGRLKKVGQGLYYREIFMFTGTCGSSIFVRKEEVTLVGACYWFRFGKTFPYFPYRRRIQLHADPTPPIAAIAKKYCMVVPDHDASSYVVHPDPTIYHCITVDSPHYLD